MANFNFNKVILGGRLTANPEIKQTQSGVPVCTFSIAVNRKYTKEGQQQEVDFISCTAWRNTAEFLGKYFKKGSSICVVGSIQVRSWTDSNNQKRYATDVMVDEVLFVDSKNESQGAQDAGAMPYIPDAYKVPDDANMEAVSGDDDLPF